MSLKKDVFKEQYFLKRNFYYFLGTKIHIYFLLFCFLLQFFTGNFQNFILTYPIGSLFLYRFIFKIKKDDNPYKKIFCLILWNKFLLKLKEQK